LATNSQWVGSPHHRWRHHCCRLRAAESVTVICTVVPVRCRRWPMLTPGAVMPSF